MELLVETPRILELKMADPNMDRASLLDVKENLDRLFGNLEWADLELETISLTLGLILSQLTVDKIHILQILVQQPELFTEDPVFMFYATEVINNNVADFEYFPTPTSLELAYAIEEVRKVFGSLGFTPEFGYTIKTVIGYILKQEGYSKPISPFDFVDPDMLEKGQTEIDTKHKEKAIKEYIFQMNTL